jgi:hypothetical protein
VASDTNVDAEGNTTLLAYWDSYPPPHAKDDPGWLARTNAAGSDVGPDEERGLGISSDNLGSLESIEVIYGTEGGIRFASRTSTAVVLKPRADIAHPRPLVATLTIACGRGQERTPPHSWPRRPGPSRPQR